MCGLVALVAACGEFVSDDSGSGQEAALGRVHAIGSVGGPHCPILAEDGQGFTITSPAGVDRVMKDGGEHAVPLALAPTLDALVGEPLVVHFDNLVPDAAADHAWSVCAPVGVQGADRWSWTPDAPGIYPLHVIVWDDGRTTAQGVVRAELRVHEVGARAGQVPKVMFLGDSTTSDGHLIAALQDAMDADLMGVEPVGTLPADKPMHEGRSGWRISTYHGLPELKVAGHMVGNAFFYDGKFDFNSYLAANPVPLPDVFFVHLGINDVVAVDGEKLLAVRIPEMLTQLDDILASVRQGHPAIQLAVGLTIVPCSTDAGFVATYGKARRAQAKRNMVRWAAALIEHYRDQSHIALVPLNARIDAELGYPHPPNAGPVKHSNAVHPNALGYRQMADTIHAWLKGQVPAP